MTKSVESFSRAHYQSSQTKQNIEYYERLEHYFENSMGTTIEKLENFSKYVPRQVLTRFLSRYEIYKRILNISGSIVECGVLHGGGLMSFAQLSAIFEPVHHHRKIIGFDTFSGFASVDKKDTETADEASKISNGALSANSYDDLLECAELYDMNRFLSHMERVILVKGDVCETVPQYVKKNPHLVVSLLYLDMDLYKPTKTAIQHLVPRIPKGGIIVFDELNAPNFPGETMAVMEEIGISNLKIERMSFDSCMSFAVID